MAFSLCSDHFFTRFWPDFPKFTLGVGIKATNVCEMKAICNRFQTSVTYMIISGREKNNPDKHLTKMFLKLDLTLGPLD